jgi:hypothetical protein
MKRRRLLETIGSGALLGGIAGCTGLNLAGIGDSCPRPIDPEFALEFEAVESKGGTPFDGIADTFELVPSAERLREVNPDTAGMPEEASRLVEETDFGVSFLLFGQLASSADSSRIRFTGVEQLDTDTIRSFSCIENPSDHDDGYAHGFVARVEKPDNVDPEHASHYHGETDNQTRLPSNVGEPKYRPHPSVTLTPDSSFASADPPSQMHAGLVAGFSPQSPARIRIGLTNTTDDIQEYPIGGTHEALFGDPVLEGQDVDHHLLLVPNGRTADFGLADIPYGQEAGWNVPDAPIEGYWYYRHTDFYSKTPLTTRVRPRETAAHEFLLIDPGLGGLVPQKQPFPDGDYRFVSSVGLEDSKWGFTISLDSNDGPD